MCSVGTATQFLIMVIHTNLQRKNEIRKKIEFETFFSDDQNEELEQMKKTKQNIKQQDRTNWRERKQKIARYKKFKGKKQKMGKIKQQENKKNVKQKKTRTAIK